MICKCGKKIDGRLKISKEHGLCEECLIKMTTPVVLNMADPVELRLAPEQRIIPGFMSEKAVEEDKCKKEKEELYPVAGIDLSGVKPKKRFWEFWK